MTLSYLLYWKHQRCHLVSHVRSSYFLRYQREGQTLLRYIDQRVHTAETQIPECVNKWETTAETPQNASPALAYTCNCSPSDISSSLATVPIVLCVEYVVVVILDGLLVTLASLGSGFSSNFITGMSAPVSSSSSTNVCLNVNDRDVRFYYRYQDHYLAATKNITQTLTNLDFENFLSLKPPKLVFKYNIKRSKSLTLLDHLPLV